MRPCICLIRSQVFDKARKAVLDHSVVSPLVLLVVELVVACPIQTVFVCLLMRLPVIAHQYLLVAPQTARVRLRLAALMRLCLVPHLIAVVSHAQPPVAPA